MAEGEAEDNNKRARTWESYLTAVMDGGSRGDQSEPARGDGRCKPDWKSCWRERRKVGNRLKTADDKRDERIKDMLAESSRLTYATISSAISASEKRTNSALEKMKADMQDQIKELKSDCEKA